MKNFPVVACSLSCILHALVITSTAADRSVTTQELRPHHTSHKPTHAVHHVKTHPHHHNLRASSTTASPATIEPVKQDEPVVQTEEASGDQSSSETVATADTSLPDVSTIMKSSTQTMAELNKKTDALQKRLSDLEKNNAETLSEEKKKFEAKLSEQDARNTAIESTNTDIKGAIADLKKSTDALQAEDDDLQRGNAVLRSELKLLGDREETVKNYLSSALKDTDTAGQKELAVLSTSVTSHASKARQSQVVKKAKHDEDSSDDDDDDSDDDEDDAAPSFLTMKMQTDSSVNMSGAGDSIDFDKLLSNADDSQAAPDDILTVLNSGVKKLEAEGKANVAKLKTLFLSSYKAGVKRRDTLMAQQKKLNATHAEFETLQGKLVSAKAHLSSTREDLTRRLQAVGHFMLDLSNLSLSPLGPTTPQRMENIAKSIELPPVQKTDQSDAADTALSSSSAEDVA